ncbi:MAG: uroporphyrinogen decarboxylase family protein [Negativicutes bacterium]
MRSLTKRERIFNLLAGKPIDCTPVGFWLHFPEAMHHGDNAVQAHLDFMKHTDTDILKIMNENLLYDGQTQIRCLDDIRKFRGFGRQDRIFRDQMEIIRRIADSARGEYPIVSTIHGLVASMFHETGFAGKYASMGYCLALFCRERPQEMKRAFRMVADTLMEMVDCSLEAGAEGIFYAALGGERHFFTDEEYAEFVAPFEAEIYRHIRSKTPFDILHICKSNISFERYPELKPSIVNWSVYGNGFSLTAGAWLFPDSIILGGFQDRSGVLVDGSEEDIGAHTRKVLTEMKGRRFIIGSDCTLPTEIEYRRINSVVKAAERLES